VAHCHANLGPWIKEGSNFQHLYANLTFLWISYSVDQKILRNVPTTLLQENSIYCTNRNWRIFIQYFYV